MSTATNTPVHEGLLIVGGGAWGTALAQLTARAGLDAYLWARDPDQVATMIRDRRNERYLPGVDFHPRLLPIADLAAAPESVTCVMAAVPLQQLRTALQRVRSERPKIEAVICASKGVERESLEFAHDIVGEELPDDVTTAVLSGPNFAGEVARGLPAAAVIACESVDYASALGDALQSSSFRPYAGDDVVGVEVGGAVKNVIAIAAGISDGLRLGANARAALITRGLAEMARFGVALGGRRETFMGLGGVGDLVLTCADDKSRNRRFGLGLAAGLDQAAAAEAVGLVEGAATAAPLVARAARLGVEMPIAQQVALMLEGRCTPGEAVERLMARETGSELD